MVTISRRQRFSSVSRPATRIVKPAIVPGCRWQRPGIDSVTWIGAQEALHHMSESLPDDLVGESRMLQAQIFIDSGQHLLSQPRDVIYLARETAAQQ